MNKKKVENYLWELLWKTDNVLQSHKCQCSVHRELKECVQRIRGLFGPSGRLEPEILSGETPEDTHERWLSCRDGERKG